MGHEDAAQGPGQVAGDEDPEALQQAQPFGHFRGKEQLAQGQGEKYEDDEVVDFQGTAQGGQAQGLVVGAGKARRRRLSGRGHKATRWQHKAKALMVYAKDPGNNPFPALGWFSGVFCTLNGRAPGQ